MNRNSENKFANIPNINVQRSIFDRNSGNKTTFNTGELVPIYIDEVLPGDTFTMETSAVVRMSTPIFPTMDNAYLDTYYFYVPNRLVWDKWKEFNGENTTAPWTQTTEYEIPQITGDPNLEPDFRKIYNKSLMDYFGIPTGLDTKNISISHLPFRAYCLIWNEWFRDQNLQTPVNISKGEAVTYFASTSPFYDNITPENAQRGIGLLPVNKFHDYFTSALPEPQKGEPVLLPLGEWAPVMPGEDHPTHVTNTWDAMRWNLEEEQGEQPFQGGLGYISPLGTVVMNETGSGPGQSVIPSNLWTDLGQATAATINELRQAFQIQRLFERDARGGTRYTELIRSHFGVTSPDARMQRPEYLGGNRQPINMDQVVQTSETTNNSPQGNTAAYSLTGGQQGSWTKSFTEHGYIIGLACVRTDHTYQQGINRIWSRRRRFDYYWPALAHIGEQAILNKEIYAGTNKDEEAFGYQEAWSEYRYKPSMVTGEFRSQYSQSLDSWHYADNYEERPKLSEDWIKEPRENVDRTLAVSNILADQFIADFYFKCRAARPMPIYSVPGMIDHF